MRPPEGAVNADPGDSEQETVLMSREMQASSQTEEDHNSRRASRVGAMAGAPGLFLAAAPHHSATTPVPSPAPTGGNPAGGLLNPPSVTHLLNGVAHNPLELVCVIAACGVTAVGLNIYWGITGEDNGFAKRRELNKKLSGNRLRKKKVRAALRPALANHKKRHVRPTDLGFFTGTSVNNAHVDTYLPLGDPLAIVAPPGAGKTAYLLNLVLDAPGAVYTTSTKWEALFLAVAALRGLMGSPVEFFNPEGLGGQPSTIAWDPVRGCKDPQVAMRRAGYLLSGSPDNAGSENRAFWSGSNFDVLKSFLWAADTAGLTLLDVARWSKAAGDRGALDIMKKYGGFPVNWDSDLSQVQDNPNDRTNSNIFKTLALTFSFLSDPTIAEIVASAHRVERPFDPQAHMLAKGTLFMIGSDRQFAGIGPLFTALTGEIKYTADMLSSRMPGAKMEPPPAFILDEAALICSVPLEQWTSDSRGKGITIILAMQTKSQMYQRWGQHAANTIWSNCTKLILGGLSEDEARGISEACGMKWVVTTTTTTQSGSSNPQQQGMFAPTPRSVSKGKQQLPVRNVSEVMGIEPGEMLLLRRQTKPVMVSYRPVWERKDVKAQLAAMAKAEKLTLKAEKRRIKDERRAAKSGYAQPVWPQQAPVDAPPQQPVTPVMPPQAPAWPQPVQPPYQAPAAASTGQMLVPGEDQADSTPPGWWTQQLPAQRDTSVYAQQDGEDWPLEGIVPIPPQASPVDETPVVPPLPPHAPTVHLGKPAAPLASEQAAPSAAEQRRRMFSEWEDDEEVG